ncbi:MAG: HAD family phosphatase [Eubacterium sp.]|nr:HAD family phosphatase [Eubacterium sp.]
MSYELIGLDLDGTLTDSNKEISENTRRALFRLMEKGKKVVLVSGRSIYGVMPLARELKLDQYDGYVMGFNGGQVVSCRTGEVLHDYLLPGGVAESVYKVTSSYQDVALITYHQDTIITGRRTNQYVELEAFGSRMAVRETDHFAEETAGLSLNKVVACGDPVYISEIMVKLKDKFGASLNLFTSDPYFGEVMPKGIDKGYSLQMLVESLGFTSNQVICCGDSGNDIPMIRYAGLGVAMGNALPEVKAAADYVTLTNDEEGVLHVIEKYML